MPVSAYHNVTEAIILAAGLGSRLEQLFASKPIATVHGTSLIEIAIRQAAAAGIEHVVVVTGHMAERVEYALEEIQSRLNVTVTPVRLKIWDRPNGWSVLAGAEAVRDNFLLMMADHVFGDGLLPRLARSQLVNSDAILATDRPDNPLVDPEDATWVHSTDEGYIRHIGKQIKSYNAVDCGAFLASQMLPKAIEAAIADGKAGSLSDGMQMLAAEGRARTLDVSNTWWLDVDDPRAHDLAVKHAPDHISWLHRRTEDRLHCEVRNG